MAFHAADTHRATSEGTVRKGRLKERCGLEPRTNFFRLRNWQKLVRIRFGCRLDLRIYGTMMWNKFLELEGCNILNVSTRLGQFMTKPFQALSVVPEVLLCVCSHPALVSYVFSHMGYFCQIPVLFSDYETSHLINPHRSLRFLSCKPIRANVH